jgi:glucose/arabinose dehydrogenase
LTPANQSPRQASKRLVVKAAVVLCLFAALVPSAAGSPQRAEYRFRQVASGFGQPVYVAQPKSEPGRLYVVERAGRIVVLANGKRSRFLDIRGRVERGYVEQGLLSVAFDPRYAKNHRFYVYYTNKAGDIEVDSFRSRGGRAVLSSRRQSLVINHRANKNHDGGQLEFGPDGLLYAGTGDGGSGGDPPDNSQNLSRQLGKLLRLSGGRWQIYAYGLRNPWRFSFDRANGDLYIGDVGQNAWEEIDYRPRAAQGLANYGWSAYEGRARYKPSRLNRTGTLVMPVRVYSHAGGNCSVTGGYVYRGSAVPSARGRYFYGDYCSGALWSFRISGGRAVDNRREGNIAALSSFGQAANGELYAVSLNGGLYRLSK